MIDYFVSFSHRCGFGNSNFLLENEISSIEQIRAMEKKFNKLLAKEGLYQDANVLFFQKLSETSEEEQP